MYIHTLSYTQNQIPFYWKHYLVNNSVRKIPFGYWESPRLQYLVCLFVDFMAANNLLSTSCLLSTRISHQSLTPQVWGIYLVS